MHAHVYEVHIYTEHVWRAVTASAVGLHPPPCLGQCPIANAYARLAAKDLPSHLPGGMLELQMSATASHLTWVLRRFYTSL